MYLLLQQIKFKYRYNTLIYYLRRIPGIGKIIPEELYNIQVLYILFSLMTLPTFIFIKLIPIFVYVVAVTYLPSLLSIGIIGGFHFGFVALAMILSALLLDMLDNKLISNINFYDALFLDKLKIKPDKLYRINVLQDYIIDFVTYLLMMFLASVFTDLLGLPSLVELLYFVCFLMGIKGICYMLALFFHQKHWLDSKWIFLVLMLIFYGLVAISTAAFLTSDLDIIDILNIGFYYVSHPIAAITSIVICTFSIWRVLSYKDYALVRHYHLNNYEVKQQVIKKKRGRTLIKTQTKDSLKNVDLTPSDSVKTGYDMLNDLFFKRHKKFLFKKAIPQLMYAVFLVLAGLTLGLIAYYSTFNTAFLYDGFLPNLFYFAYLSTVSRPIVQILFANCDAALLNYGFYRQRGVVLKTFKQRFIQMLKYDSIWLIGAMIGNICYIVLSARFDIFLPTSIVFISIYLIFGFHDLFIYYMLQPYTKEFQNKNPVYKFITAVMSFVALIAFYSSISLTVLTVILPLIAVTYIGIGLPLMYIFAHKTFKLHE